MKKNPWLSLSGGPALLAALSRRQEEYEDRCEAAATAGAMIVEEAARSRARRKSGELAGSIGHRTAEKGESSCVVAVGPKAFHGYYIELGTKKMSAFPYLRPALIENKDKVIEAVRNEFKQG